MIRDRNGAPIPVAALAGYVAAEVFGTSGARLRRAEAYGGAAGSSWRLDFEHAGQARTVFVKLPAESGARYALFASRLRDEYRVSCEIKSAFPETGELRTVTPVAFIEAVQGFATWAVAGANLEALLRRSCRRVGGSLAAARRYCALAAAWVTRFHRLPTAHTAAEARTLLDTYYDDRLETLAQISASGIGAETAADIKGCLIRLADRAVTDSRIVLCHNDYSPHNMLVDGSTLYVLDYSFAGPGLPEFDVACFWHKLEDMRGGLLVSNARVAALQDAFTGALDRPFDPSDAAFRLGLARLVLSKMITILRSPPQRAGRRRVARWRRWLASGLDPAEL